MLTQRYFSFRYAISSSLGVFLWMGSYSALIVLAHLYAGWDWLTVPALPVSVLGTAVSFYLGFKGNSAYGRLWEARKIWGGIVNTSRTWGVHITGMVTDDGLQSPSSTSLPAVHKELVYRHIAWLAALRTQLRRMKSWEHHTRAAVERREVLQTHDMSAKTLEQRVAPWVSQDELTWLMARKNQSTQLLFLQSK